MYPHLQWGLLFASRFANFLENEVEKDLTERFPDVNIVVNIDVKEFLDTNYFWERFINEDV